MNKTAGRRLYDDSRANFLHKDEMQTFVTKKNDSLVRVWPALLPYSTIYETPTVG